MTQKKKYNQVKALLSIARASFLSISRNPSAVIFTILFPLIFIVVFGFIKGGSISLHVGIHPQTDTTSAIYRAFKNVPNVEIDHERSLTQMEEALHKGRIDAILNIHKS